MASTAENINQLVRKFIQDYEQNPETATLNEQMKIFLKNIKTITKKTIPEGQNTHVIKTDDLKDKFTLL